MPKKKITEQELKDRLWRMVTETDIESGDDINTHEDFDSWTSAYLSSVGKSTVKIAGFEATLVDVRKIISEVEDSCLTDACKKSLTKALKSAK